MRIDRSPGTRTRGAAVVLACLLLAACGVRVETPPPPPPTPGPLEQVRQAAAVASASLAEDAGRAASDTLDERRFAVLERIRLDAEEHVEVLGGVYSLEEGGLVETGAEEDPDEVDAADDVPEPEPVDPADLVVRLVNEATAARGAADRVDDGGLARLLTVVATARLLAADALARDLEVERPGLAREVLPTTLPQGVATQDLARLVVAEDQAAFALELVAARSQDSVRRRARAAAERHRATSDAWARLAGLAEPGLDPREVSYALGGALETEESRADLAARVEHALVVSYAALVALAEPGSRAELAALHTLAAESARRWGLAPGALPGLDEQDALTDDPDALGTPDPSPPDDAPSDD
mgnify:CR=1 FL=1